YVASPISKGKNTAYGFAVGTAGRSTRSANCGVGLQFAGGPREVIQLVGFAPHATLGPLDRNELARVRDLVFLGRDFDRGAAGSQQQRLLYRLFLEVLYTTAALIAAFSPCTATLQ